MKRNDVWAQYERLVKDPLLLPSNGSRITNPYTERHCVISSKEQKDKEYEELKICRYLAQEDPSLMAMREKRKPEYFFIHGAMQYYDKNTQLVDGSGLLSFVDSQLQHKKVSVTWISEALPLVWRDYLNEFTRKGSSQEKKNVNLKEEKELPYIELVLSKKKANNKDARRSSEKSCCLVM